MAEKVVKVIPTICALLYAADPLFIFLGHKVIIEELMEIPCVGLEVGNSLSYKVALGVYSTVRSCLIAHDV